MKDLALNEDQTGKLKQMDAQYNKLHASGQAGVTDADLMRRRDAEVQAILTPDQYAKWGKQHTAAAPAQQAKPATMATPAQPASKPAPATPAQPATKPAPKPASK